MRTLELTISGRLDGVLHGNYQGLTPGHGSEPGESRPYQPGDDVRRIDWNITARTRETYVREQIADHDLTAWLVVDASATMQFGTVANDKAQVATAAAACVGFLTARNQNRLGRGTGRRPVDPRRAPPFRARTRCVRCCRCQLAAPVRGIGPRRPRRRDRPGRGDRQAARIRRGDLRLPRRRLAAVARPTQPAPRSAGDHGGTTRASTTSRRSGWSMSDPATGASREVRVTGRAGAVRRRRQEERRRTDALGRSRRRRDRAVDRQRLARRDRPAHPAPAGTGRARRGICR